MAPLGEGGGLRRGGLRREVPRVDGGGLRRVAPLGEGGGLRRVVVRGGGGGLRRVAFLEDGGGDVRPPAPPRLRELPLSVEGRRGLAASRAGEAVRA